MFPAGPPYVSKVTIETLFAPLVVGKSPFDSEMIWDAMLKAGAVAGPAELAPSPKDAGPPGDKRRVERNRFSVFFKHDRCVL